MFCCSCRRLSPPHSVYCSQCVGKRSFNGIVCGGGHRCQVGTVTCPTCGSDEFSDYTRGIPVDWVAKLATILLLVYVWKLGLAHHCELLPALWMGITQLFGFLTNSNACALENLLSTVFAWGFIVWIIGLWMNILPSQGWALGRFLRSLPVRVYQLTLRWIPRLLVLLWRGVVRVSGLATNKSAALLVKSKDKPGKAE
jgi:hypothetical protein